MRDEIIKVIYDAVEELNQQLPENNKLEKSLDQELYGMNGELDSLGLVNLVVATEQNVEESLDVLISLSDQRAMSQKNSPFRTIRTLADYVENLIVEQRGS